MAEKVIYVAKDNCTAVTIYGKFQFVIGNEVPSYVAKKYPRLVERVVVNDEENEEESTKKGRKKNG